MAGPGDARGMDEEEWLRRTGIPPCHAASVAFRILAHSRVFPALERSPLHRGLLSGVYGDPALAAQLMAWRLPGADLDLLQLAVLYNDHEVVRELARNHWPEGDYRDVSGMYRNHPLHLASHSAGPEIVSRILLVRRDQLPGEGEVSVRVDAGQCAPESPVLRLSRPVPGSVLTFAALNSRPVAPALLSHFLLTRRQQRFTRQQIEQVWASLDLVYHKGLAPQAAYSLACPYRCECDQPVDYCLMVSQLFGRDTRPIGNDCVALCALAHQAMHMLRPELVQEAARYCSQKQLCEFVHHVTNWRPKDGRDSNNDMVINEKKEYTFNHRLDATVWEQAIAIFREEQANRTLEQEAFLTILRSLGGNPRKAKLLEQLPPPLLAKFRVPFLDLHKELTVSSLDSQLATSQ